MLRWLNGPASILARCVRVHTKDGENTMRTSGRSVLVVLSYLLASGSAAVAAPIDNEGPFTWTTGWGNLDFRQSSPHSTTLGANSGGWTTYIDTAGNLIMSAMTLQAVTISGYTVEVIVLDADSGGTLDASVGGYNTKLTLRLRVKITGGSPSVGGFCITAPFYVDVEGAYVWTSPAPGKVDLYTGLSGSGSGVWQTVPALTGLCNGYHTALNTLLGFGVTNGGMRFDRIEARTTNGPRGS